MQTIADWENCIFVSQLSMGDNYPLCYVANSISSRVRRCYLINPFTRSLTCRLKTRHLYVLVREKCGLHTVKKLIIPWASYLVRCAHNWLNFGQFDKQQNCQIGNSIHFVFDQKEIRNGLDSSGLTLSIRFFSKHGLLLTQIFSYLG